jgi:tryptophan synthase alpha chain
MSAISSKFRQCHRENRAALIPYVTAGYPNEKSFVALLKSFAQEGADLIEIGVPFSDPLADGPTIQYSSERALKRGVTLSNTFEALTKIKEATLPPLVMMSYLNPLLQYGVEKFARDAGQCGVRGVIVPDIIPEEGDFVSRACRNLRLDLIYLLAPTSTPERRQMILRKSRGFVYLVSITGVTGARKELPRELNQWIHEVKDQSTIPAAVGFGIAKPEQAHRVAQVADGVIVGSAIIDILRNGSSNGAVKKASAFVRKLRRAVQR